MAYDQLDPFGETRADLRMATLAAVAVNTHKGKKGRSAKPKDFMFEFYKSKPKKTMDWQEQLAQVEMINAQFKGKDLRDGDVS